MKSKPFRGHPKDFAEPPEESLETQTIRIEVLGLIDAEFDRLNLDGEMRELIACYRGLGNPDTASPLDLFFFWDWLRGIERR